MKRKQILTSAMMFSAAAVLAACSTDGDTTDPVSSETAASQSSMEVSSESMAMSEHGEGEHEMVHDESGEIPEGLQPAKDPTYKVGDKVIIQTDHMEGMDGAEATIVGAYDTIAYAISYDPMNGGPREESHKWVIQEEIADAGEEPLEPGTEVTVNAKHMEGMQGATATIDTAEKTTVYMINYEPTTGGREIKNHQWVTEQEIEAK